MTQESDVLPQMHAAKAHSDNRRYGQKHRIMAVLIKRNPAGFVIDSDDGKGIVGITHLESGFRMHLPKQVIPVQLEKMASIFDRTVKFLNKHPRAESLLRKITSYRLMDPRNRWKNMLAGSVVAAPVGGALGALKKDEDGSRHRGAVYGALAGAGTGAVAGGVLPRVAQRTLGRILTNVVAPFRYETDYHKRALGNVSRRDILKAIRRDEPLYNVEQGMGSRTLRSNLYRRFFGLKPFKGTETAFDQLGKMPDGGDLVKHNLRNPAAREDLREIHRNRDLGLMTGEIRRGSLQLGNAPSLGNFTIRPDGQFEDVWDFALNSGEKIDDKSKLMRALITPFGTPAKVVGRTLNESQVARFIPAGDWLRSKMHPSMKALFDELSPRKAASL